MIILNSESFSFSGQEIANLETLEPQVPIGCQLNLMLRIRTVTSSVTTVVHTEQPSHKHNQVIHLQKQVEVNSLSDVSPMDYFVLRICMQ